MVRGWQNYSIFANDCKSLSALTEIKTETRNALARRDHFHIMHAHFDTVTDITVFYVSSRRYRSATCIYNKAAPFDIFAICKTPSCVNIRDVPSTKVAITQF